MAEVLDARVRAYLARQRVGRLATATADGEPSVVPICYAVVGQRLYSPIDEKPKQRSAGIEGLRRVRNLRQNPGAAVVVDTYSEDWQAIGFVLLRGTVRLLQPQDGAEHPLALAALRDRYAQYHAMDLESRPVLALDIARVVTWGPLFEP